MLDEQSVGVWGGRFCPGCWILDARYWMLDARYWMLDTRLGKTTASPLECGNLLPLSFSYASKFAAVVTTTAALPASRIQNPISRIQYPVSLQAETAPPTTPALPASSIQHPRSRPAHQTKTEIAFRSQVLASRSDTLGGAEIPFKL